MEMLELCRLCALEKDNLLGIYDSEGLRLTLDAKIKKYLNIEVSEKENFPKSICLDCYCKLDAFEEFLESSINAQATLSIIFPDKSDKFAADPLPGEDRDQSDEDYVETESYILGSSSNEELNIGKPIFLSPDKPFVDPPSESNECNSGMEKCDGTPTSTGILSVPQSEASDPLSYLPVQESQETSQEPERKDSDVKGKLGNFECTSWLCSDCSEQFNDIEDLRQHHRTEHNQDARYMCNFCAKVLIDCAAFLNHVRRHRNSLKYSCDICGKAFSNRKVVEAHILSHSDSRPFECPECGKTFRQQSSLFIHSKCHLPDSVKCKFPCELCDKRFSTKPNLLTHMRIHSGVRNFTCDQCGKSFIQKGNLDAHLLTHSHDKPFECEICKKRFKTSMQLRKHHSIHTGAKPHQCDVCGRTFREKGTLKEHHRIHTGAMPFTCEFCGKSFRFKGILTTHRRQHTGERPYSCLECQHHFTNWPNYNKHMKRRHGINTSRSCRTDKAELQPIHADVTQQPQPTPASAPTPIYQEIQSSDLYANIQAQPLNTLPTYMAYNVYSLSNVATLDGTTIEIMPRQTITLKEEGNGINFSS